MRRTKSLLMAAMMLPVIVPGKVVAQRSGAQVWAENCGNCHILQPANRYKAEQWAIIVQHMQINARLTTAETDAVHEFLQAGARRSVSAEPELDGSIQVVSNDPAFLPALGQDGEEIYKKQCVACHGKSGEGNGPAAVALNPRPADLTDKEAMEALTDEELRKIIGQGMGSMPALESILEPDEIEAVVEYVRSLSAEQ